MSNISESSPDVEQKSNRNIVLGVVLGYVSIALAIVSGLIFTPWIIRSIGKSEHGVYAIAISVINLFLVDFGLSGAVNRFASKYRTSGEAEKLRTILGLIYKIYFFLDIIVASVFVVIYFFAHNIYQQLTFDQCEELKNVILIVGAYSLLSFPATTFDGILKAYEDFAVLKLIEILQKLVYIGLTIAAIYFHFGLYALVFANVISGLLMIFSKWVYIRFKIKIKVKIFTKSDKNDLKVLFSYSLWTAIMSICSRLIFNVVPSIIGIVGGKSGDATIEASVFSVASNIEDYISTFGSVLTGFFMPKVMRIQANDNEADCKEKIQNLSEKTGRIQLILVGLIIVGFAACGQDFIAVWMKDDTYSPAYLGAILISIYQFFYTPTLVFKTAVITDKNIKYVSFVELFAAILNVALCFLLVSQWGMMGACVSIFISSSVRMVALYFLYSKTIGANIPHFLKVVYGRQTIVCLVSLASGLLFTYFAKISDLKVKLLINVVLTASIYLLMSFFLLKKEERLFLFSIFKKKSNK